MIFLKEESVKSNPFVAIRQKMNFVYAPELYVYLLFVLLETSI
jgi:hypothetical protein